MIKEDKLEALKADIARKEKMLKEREKQKLKEEKLKVKAAQLEMQRLKRKKEVVRQFIEEKSEEVRKMKKDKSALPQEIKEQLDILLAAKGVETDFSKEYEAKVKEVDVTKKGSWTDISFIISRIKAKFWKGTSLFVNMEMRNGMNKHFVAYLKQPYFIHKGGLYIIDDELKYWVSTLGMFALDYHQDLSIPIKRKINLNEIQHTVQSIDSFEVETALNPHSLKQWLESDVVQKIIKGQELDEFMRRLMTITIIAALSSLAMLLLFMWKSGMFEQIKGQLPF